MAATVSVTVWLVVKVFLFVSHPMAGMMKNSTAVYNLSGVAKQTTNRFVALIMLIFCILSDEISQPFSSHVF